MITIKPDAQIRAKFGHVVDFDVLSAIYSLMYDSLKKSKRKIDYIITLKMTKGGWSYYDFQEKRRNIRINISEDISSSNVFQATLLHEFRHFVQDRIFKVSWGLKEYDDSTFEKYKNSRSEIDALTFDKLLGRKITRLHNKLKKTKATWKNFDTYNVF
jgi:hypothetical protein